MNELMDALEAMIRRIVREEMENAVPVDQFADGNFRAALKNYADDHRHEFAALVSIGALDMPWFDEAIKAEVAGATPAASGSLDLYGDAFRNRVVEIIEASRTPPGYTFATKTAFEREISEIVQNNDAIEDWVNDKITDKVSDMDFSVNVS